MTRKDDPKNRIRERTRFLDSVRERRLSHGRRVYG
jgi:hypothetical protein